MNPEPSQDYHDYVFRGGKLVGDFDGMYRHSRTIPWDQDRRCDHWYAEIGMLMLREHAPYASILEVGCGLGYFSRKLAGLSAGRIEAFDISPEAVRRARELHSGIDFRVGDAADPAGDPAPNYDLVVVRELFWYVVPRLDAVLANLKRWTKPGGCLYVGQSFPALDRPFVGRERIPDPAALLKFLSGFVPLHTAQVRNHPLVDDGPILHFLGRRPA